MSINRSGECPKFIKYITELVLIPHDEEPALNEHFSQHCRYGTIRWIDVPTYQRGLVWMPDLLEDLLVSRSVLLGNAVLAQFNIPHRDQTPFKSIPNSEASYSILIDGLQRFSIGTALLNIIYRLVISETAELKSLANQFQMFKSQAMHLAMVFQYNHAQLTSHPRKAVSDSYRVFFKRLEDWLRRELSAPASQRDQRIDDLHRFFFQRQISPDVYSGFTSVNEVIDTFIGLNTTRVQLNIVDWLRSIFIDLGSKSGWSADDLAEAENLYSRTFYHDENGARKLELEPFASIVKDAITLNPQVAMRVFPSLGTGQNQFSLNEFKRFLNYIAKVQSADDNSYVNELRCCGGLPYAGLLSFGYRKYLTTDEYPSFLLDGAELSENLALFQFIKSCYRVVIDGRVGRIGQFINSLLVEDHRIDGRSATMDEALCSIANSQSLYFLDKALNQQVATDWLRTSLRKADRKRCQRIFNAMLLPDQAELAGQFSPHIYGSTTSSYQIDHLIPKTAIEPLAAGGLEGEQIINFAPVRQTANNAQSNLKCSEKLQSGGSFDRELHTDPNVHPYLRWLVEEQGSSGMQLDIQALLEPNAEIPIGDQRISKLCEILRERL